MISRIARRRRGNICRAYMFVRPGEGRAMDARDYLGTRYSFRERLDDGHLAWALRQFGDREDIRQAFQQVVTECLVG